MRLTTSPSSGTKAAKADEGSEHGERKAVTIDGEDFLDYFYDEVYRAGGTAATAGRAPEGSSSEALERILGASSRHSQSVRGSSLDIKVEGGSKRTTPPSNKKQTAKAASDVHQQRSSWEGRSGSRAGSRSRGYSRQRAGSASGVAGGGRQHRFDYSDLEHMDEEELLRALYDDPSLAAAAAEVAAASRGDESAEKRARRRARQKRRASQGGNPDPDSREDGGRFYRAADGTVKKVGARPNYIETLKEGGVPVKQWIVIGVMLGVAAYQLHKTLVSPVADSRTSKSSGKKKGEKGAGRRSLKHKGKKSTGSRTRASANKRNSPTADALVKEESTSADAVNTEQQDKEMSATDTPGKRKTSKRKRSRKSNSGKKATAAVPNKDSSEEDEKSDHSPDSVSTDGSSSTAERPQEVDQHERNGVHSSYDEDDRRAIIMTMSTEGGADEEGWQTVGRPSSGGGESSNTEKKTNQTTKPDLGKTKNDLGEMKADVDGTDHVAKSTVVSSCKAAESSDNAVESEKTAVVPLLEEETEATDSAKKNATDPVDTNLVCKGETKEKATEKKHIPEAVKEKKPDLVKPENEGKEQPHNKKEDSTAPEQVSAVTPETVTAKKPDLAEPKNEGKEQPHNKKDSTVPEQDSAVTPSTVDQGLQKQEKVVTPKQQPPKQEEQIETEKASSAENGKEKPGCDIAPKEEKPAVAVPTVETKPVPVSPSVEDDAALARILQKEEEQMVISEDNQNETVDDESWEQVVTKKKKKATATATT